MVNIFKEVDDLQAEINKFRPLSSNMLKQIREYYKIGLTYSSNALEGNSLTESETKVIIEDGITIGGKPIRDHYEALGHSEAYDLMYKLSKNSVFTEANIKRLHHLFYYRIDEKKAGKYRKEKVFISGSKYSLPRPEDVPALIGKFIAGLEKMQKKYHPVEYAALVHKEFIFIHPFIDGNGRVARLLMNLVLLQKGYVIALISPALRAEYISCLEKAHQGDREFVEFIAKSLSETQRDYLRLLK